MSKLVQHFSIRKVSKSVSLNELGRILSRNSFALVEDDKFVTSSDLLNKISPQAGDESCCTPVGCTLTKPADDPPATASNQGGSNMLQMAAATVVGMGVAAFGTFMLMNSKK